MKQVTLIVKRGRFFFFSIASTIYTAAKSQLIRQARISRYFIIIYFKVPVSSPVNTTTSLELNFLITETFTQKKSFTILIIIYKSIDIIMPEESAYLNTSQNTSVEENISYNIAVMRRDSLNLH